MLCVFDVSVLGDAGNEMATLHPQAARSPRLMAQIAPLGGSMLRDSGSMMFPATEGFGFRVFEFRFVYIL